MTRPCVVDTLRRVPLFAELGDEDLHQVASLSRPRQMEAGALLWSREERPDLLVILEQGRLKVFLSNDEGREVTLAILTPPSFLGEVSALDRSATSASVMALDACRLLCIRGEDFRGLLEERPPLLWTLLAVQTRRVRALSDELASRSFLTTRSRVARKLLQLASSGGSVEISHQELAFLVGSTRESVSRALSELERQNLVRTGKQRIEIVAPQALDDASHA